MENYSIEKSDSEKINEKPNIPLATEVFNELRSIKDSSGKDITIADIVTRNDNDYIVTRFSEREIDERYTKSGEKENVIYANLAKYKDGEVNFNSQSMATNGEVVLKEKWQPKYNNGEIIKLDDIVMANVEKYVFEIYNKKLKVIGFNIDGFVSVEVLDGKGDKRAVNPKVLKTIDK